MKYRGTLYKSRWDASTWSLIALTLICCVLPFFLNDDGILPFFVCLGVVISVLVVLKSVYYRIDDDKLIIYQFFIPQAYPIDKITEIRKVKTYLSAPATSLTHRIGISFSDKKILKSVMPLVISPVRQSEFISQLQEINPSIKNLIQE